jgi:cytochrome b6-f complex iron-sulfur subunit
MNRREVIQKFLRGGTVLVFVPSVIESCTKDPPPDSLTIPGGNTKIVLQIDLSLPENEVLNTAGNSKIFNSNIIIINTGTGFVALTAICTHQGCVVQYNSVSGNLECPCHGSKFLISGSVLQGPASVALYSFHLNVSDSVITVTYS